MSAEGFQSKRFLAVAGDKLTFAAGETTWQLKLCSRMFVIDVRRRHADVSLGETFHKGCLVTDSHFEMNV